MKTLSSLRFKLNPITEEHLPFIFEGLSNKLITKYYGVHFNSLEETKEQMNWYNNLIKNNTGKWWAIYNKESNIFLGAIGFNDFEHLKKEIEIGFWLLPKYWKQGIISECLPTTITYAFSNFNIDKIIAYIETKNTNSSNTLQKNSFKLIKTLINAEEKDGNYISLNVYSYTKSNY